MTPTFLRNKGIEGYEWHEGNRTVEGDPARGIITFDRFGTDKLVCRADPIERVTMVATPSPPLSYFLRAIRN